MKKLHLATLETSSCCPSYGPWPWESSSSINHPKTHVIGYSKAYLVVTGPDGGGKLCCCCQNLFSSSRLLKKFLTLSKTVFWNFQQSSTSVLRLAVITCWLENVIRYLLTSAIWWPSSESCEIKNERVVIWLIVFIWYSVVWQCHFNRNPMARGKKFGKVLEEFGNFPNLVRALRSTSTPYSTFLLFVLRCALCSQVHKSQPTDDCSSKKVALEILEMFSKTFFHHLPLAFALLDL